MRHKTFDDFDDEYYGGFCKTYKHKPFREKENKRGGQSRKRKRRDDWADSYFDDNEYGSEELLYEEFVAKTVDEPAPVVDKPASRPATPPPAKSSPSTPTANRAPFTASGPNVHTIRGNVVDYDGVIGIEKVEGEYNNKTTYGIKFLFAGKKGSFRIAWFNQNMRERDGVFNSEFAFWHKLKSNE